MHTHIIVEVNQCQTATVQGLGAHGKTACLGTRQDPDWDLDVDVAEEDDKKKRGRRLNQTSCLLIYFRQTRLVIHVDQPLILQQVHLHAGSADQPGRERASPDRGSAPHPGEQTRGEVEDIQQPLALRRSLHRRDVLVGPE